MYIVFEEKLLVYVFCLQNKWKKQKTILAISTTLTADKQDLKITYL